MKEILVNKNFIYHTKQLFVKMLKLQSCELYVIHPQEKTAKFYHRMIVWRQVPHLKTFYGTSSSEQTLSQLRYVVTFKKHFFGISPNTRRNNRRTSKQSHRDVSCWVAETRFNLYVDNLITGDENLTKWYL